MLKSIFMKKLLIIISVSLLNSYVFSQQKIVEWNFSKAGTNNIIELVSGSPEQINGFFDSVEGQDGQAIQFDGYTTGIERERFGINLPESFTINAWVSLGAYPWFRCPLLI